MAAIAQAAYLEQQCSPLLVAVDARMDQVYWAVYAANQQGIVELIGHEKVYTPQQVTLPKHYSQQQWIAVGDAWEVYGEQLIKTLAFSPTNGSLRRLPQAWPC